MLRYLLLLLLNLNAFYDCCADCRSCCCCSNCCCCRNNNTKSYKDKKSMLMTLNNIDDFKLTDEEKQAFINIHKIYEKYKKSLTGKITNEELNKYLAEIKKAFIKDDYLNDPNKINIYRKFPDNYEVKADKCALEWNYNCWFTATILAIFSIKKFALFLKNTNFDKNTEENRWNVLKDFLLIYENNKQLDSNIINKYRDMVAIKMFLKGYDYFLKCKEYYFDRYKEWNNSGNFFDYYGFDDIFVYVDDETTKLCIYNLINEIKTKEPEQNIKGERVNFIKKNHYLCADTSGYELYMKDFYKKILNDKIEFEITFDEEKKRYWVKQIPYDHYEYYHTKVYLFTNDTRCNSKDDLDRFVFDENIKKRYEPCALLIASPGFHICTLIKDNNDNWRLYDGLNNTNGKVIDIKKEFGNKMYFLLGGRKYYILYCFSEVFIEDK